MVWWHTAYAYLVWYDVTWQRRWAVYHLTLFRCTSWRPYLMRCSNNGMSTWRRSGSLRRRLWLERPPMPPRWARCSQRTKWPRLANRLPRSRCGARYYTYIVRVPIWSKVQGTFRLPQYEQKHLIFPIGLVYITISRLLQDISQSNAIVLLFN